MTSPVNWALLGLIIERESYAFEFARRFQEVYRNAISLGSTSHVYTAIGVLGERALVEQTPALRSGRQPKPKYRATPYGIESYGERLVGYVREDRWRQAMFLLGLPSLAATQAGWRRCSTAYQQALLEHGSSTDLVVSTPRVTAPTLI